MAALVFDNGVNQGGTGDNDWDDDTNWFGGVKPAANDDVQISADCNVSGDYSGFIMETLLIDVGDTLTVQNGGDIRFDTDAGTINGTLVIQTGGAVHFSDVTWTVTVATGNINFDGGTLNLTRVAAPTILLVNGTITTTANGGTINQNANANAGVRISMGAGGSISGFSAAARLLVDGTVGANYTYGIFANVVHDVHLKWIDVLCRGGGTGIILSGTYESDVTGCVVRGTGAGALLAAFGFSLTYTHCAMKDCFVYYCIDSLYLNATLMTCTDCTFGQTEASAPAANTRDIRLVNAPSDVILRNCILASPTPVYSATGKRVVSTAHDGDKSATGFQLWDMHLTVNVWHLITGEGIVLHTAGGNALSFVTANDTTAAENLRLRFPIALWPATHGDTIDVTLWVRTTNNTNKIKVIVDPESIYGTTREIEVTSAAADTYELATVPTYTVNTAGGVRSVIPIVVQIEEATKTWYVDDLSVNGKPQTLDYGAYDGVLPIESIGTVRSPVGLTGGIHG